MECAADNVTGAEKISCVGDNKLRALALTVPLHILLSQLQFGFVLRANNQAVSVANDYQLWTELA